MDWLDGEHSTWHAHYIRRQEVASSPPHLNVKGENNFPNESPFIAHLLLFSFPKRSVNFGSRPFSRFAGRATFRNACSLGRKRTASLKNARHMAAVCEWSNRNLHKYCAQKSEGVKCHLVAVHFHIVEQRLLSYALIGGFFNEKNSIHLHQTMWKNGTYAH